MLKELFELNQRYLDHFFDQMDLTQAEELLQLLLKCEGTIFLTGIGKSGIVGKKIAVTMVSTGTKALYISPTDALHGDLGMVADKDLFLFLSKSGESEELLSLVPFIRNKGATPIAIVSTPNSRLEHACQLTVLLPLMKELCPFDLAPTTSATIQMIFGDVLTVAMMQTKKFSLNDYALNHPAGRIGKRISLKVSDLMVRGPRIPRCHAEDLLSDILGELSSKACGCIIVVDETEVLVGIFTDGDLRRALQKYGSSVLSKSVGELMTLTPRTVQGNLLAWEAMKTMEAHQNQAITAMPVIDDQKRLMGLIKMHDILQCGL